MAVEALDHVNIRTSDVPGMVAFFRDVLALNVAERPGKTSPNDGAWLADERGHPVVHLGASHLTYPTDAARSALQPLDSGIIHHIAFNCSDYDATRSRILEQGYELVENDVPAVGLRQIFVVAPGGVLFELNFRAA